MKTNLIKWVFGLLLATIVFSACEKDKIEDNEEEVITTLKLTFVPVGGGSTVVYQFDDPDGPGGTAPTQDQIVLAPSKTYGVTVQVLNKTKTPVEDITLEVVDEAEAHRFYFEPAAGSNIAISNFDKDANGVSLGVASTWTTGAAATGKIKVTLRHFAADPPNKLEADPVNSSKSSTDIEVEFNTKIQ